MPSSLRRSFGCAWLSVLLAASLLGTIPALAADPAPGRCYAPSEAQAEQLLRLHSEMMVVALTCRQSSDGRDLTKAYTDFTRHNLPALREAEATLARHYAVLDGGGGTARLDRLRTLLANEFAQSLANASAPAFCAEKRDLVAQRCDSSPQALQEEASRLRAPLHEPSCSASAHVEPRRANG